MAAKPKTRRRLPGHAFNFIYHRVPRFCVDVIIRDRRGVILVKRDIWPDHKSWNFPGGTIRQGERLDAAVRRFAWSEAGFRVNIVSCLGPIEYFRKGRISHMVSIAYLAKPVSGKPRGSWQGKEVAFWRSAPKHTVVEQKAFLVKHHLIRK